jgi:hypothetical protein
LDGRNETLATATATQKLINSHFSAELSATVFHTQQSVLKLLEASDNEFKEALSTLVDFSLWQKGEGAAKESERTARDLMHGSIGSEQTIQSALASSQWAASALKVPA